MSKKGILAISEFRGGSNLLLDEANLAPNESKTALNLVQVQQGLWQPRWGSAYYGADLGAACDGAKEFVKSDGTTELVAVAGGKAYKSTDGGSWTEITGATFTAGTQCYFMQIAGYLYIANGTDLLARYDGSVLTTYSSVAAPTNLAASLVASGLSSGTYTYYAQVTALNEVGETVGSTEASIAVNKKRDSWVSTTDKVTWSWTASAGATAYQLYLADTSGREALLIGLPTTSYVDNGTQVINQFSTIPLQNTTTAPKFKSMTVSGNRIWATNDPGNPFMAYWSGTGTDMGKFASFYGGGWINLEKGGRERPTAVVHYQTGTGTGMATFFCRTPEGRGAIWQISIDSLTVGSTTISLPNATKVVGSFGTDAIMGVVPTTNDVIFPNLRGVYSLGSEKNYYGLLRTNELSTKIRPYWRALNSSKLSGIAGYFYDSKVFFSVPTNSTGNTRTIIYDLELVNWTVEWTIGAKSFFEYTDSTGKTHFMYYTLTGTKLIELSQNIQGDLGAGFPTTYVSGRMPMSLMKSGKMGVATWKDFVFVRRMFIKIGSPRGAVSISVSGTQKNNTFRSIGTATITATTANTGMGWDLMGSVEMGDTSGVPQTFSDSSTVKYLRINKKLRDIQITVSSNTYDSMYTLQEFLIEGNLINSTAPSSWRLTT